MKQVIIVEGPDLAGKTTIIENLGKRLNQGIIIKNLYKPKTENGQIWNQYFNILETIRESKLNTFILDRFYPSQLVYSILRGKDDIIEKMDYFEAHMLNYREDMKFKIFVFIW